MKQQLISFLGDLFMPDLERIDESHLLNYPAVDVFAKDNFFTQGLLMTLFRFATKHGYMYYMDADGGNFRMRIYNKVES